jgi:hypothetical protein
MGMGRSEEENEVYPGLPWRVLISIRKLGKNEVYPVGVPV